MTGPQAVILGLDGATLDVIEPWVQAGALPNLGAILKHGSYGTLRSTNPFVTPLAWPSLYTGTNPGKHGIVGFHLREPDSYRWRVMSYADLTRPTLWDFASKAGLRSAVLFAPFTYPARPLEGSLVSGPFGSRRIDARTTYPPELGEELKSRFDEAALFGLRKSPGFTIRDVARRIEQGVREQTAAMCHVLERGDDYDLVFPIWFDTDRAAHLLWHHSEAPCPDLDSPMFSVYAAVDEGIGRVLEAAGGDPLIVACSDHGTCPVKHRINAHLWLQEQGLLDLSSAPARTTVSAARAVWRRLPTSWKGTIPLRMVKSVQQKVERSFIEQNSIVKWDSTRVYPQITSAEAFYLNLAGREPLGTVQANEAEEVVRDLSARLMSLRSPDGDPLVDKVHLNRDLYSGPHAHLAPDLVVDHPKGVMFAAGVSGDRDVYSTPDAPDLDGPPVSLGYHQRDGFIALSGARVAKGKRLRAHVTDVTPTVLAYLGVPLSSSFDGHVLEDAFTELPDIGSDDVDTFERPETGLTSEEEEQIAGQLRELGYLE